MSDQMVIVNGCFDLLHYGHVHLLKEASKAGDLYVLINTDESVKRLKGPNRPIIPYRYRVMMLEAIRYVHAVVGFTEESELEDFVDSHPEALVFKGSEYETQVVHGGKWNDRLRFVPTLTSTTEIIEMCRTGLEPVRP